MSDQNDRVPYLSVWRHIKTSNLYVAKGVAVCATNGPGEGVRSVVYWPGHDGGTLYYRELSEFLTKFQRVT